MTDPRPNMPYEPLPISDEPLALPDAAWRDIFRMADEEPERNKFLEDAFREHARRQPDRPLWFNLINFGRRCCALFALLLLLAGSAGAQSLLLDEDFEDSPCATTTAFTLVADATKYTPNTAETTFVSSPAHGGSCAGNYYILSGTNETQPWTINLGASDLSTIGISDTDDEFYVEWHEYFDGSYCFPTSSQKLFRAGFESGANKKEIGVLIQSNNGDVNFQYFCGQWGDSSLCNVSGSENSGDPIDLDTWVKFGIHVKFNSVGNSDGFIKLYKDDVLYLDTGAVSNRGNSTKGIDFLWIGGNYSMLSGNAACSGNRYIDDVKVYDTYPGAGPTPTPTATATPTPTPTPTPGPTATPTPTPGPAGLPYVFTQ